MYLREKICLYFSNLLETFVKTGEIILLVNQFYLFIYLSAYAGNNYNKDFNKRFKSRDRGTVKGAG